MSDFLMYLEKTFTHNLLTAWYYHILFLIILSVPYSFKDWQKTLKTFGFFLSGIITMLFLLNFDIISIKNTTTQFLVYISILAFACYHLLTAGKIINNQIANIVLIFFGFIHGLYFYSLYKNLLLKTENNLLDAAQLIATIIATQIIILLLAILLGHIFQIILKFSKRDWALVTTSAAIGMVIIKIINIKF